MPSVRASVDPRIDRTRERVIGCVIALMAAEGTSTVTHQRVGAVTGLSRTTLYRHWPTAGDPLVDALSGIEQVIFDDPRQEPFEAWIVASLQRASVELAQPTTLQLTATLIARSLLDRNTSEFGRELIDRNVEALAHALHVASERAEICAEPDPAVLFSILVGPVFQRVVLERGEVTLDFLDVIVESSRSLTHCGTKRCCPIDVTNAGQRSGE